MHRPHFHKLREPPLPGSQQTTPAAPIHPTAAGVILETSTSAHGPGITDATRGTRMGATRTAGVASVTPAESFTRRITATDVQVAWAHNLVETPTLADVHRAMLAAAWAGDTGRLELYRLFARAYVARAQKAARL